MSKAFLRESDFEIHEEIPAYSETLPPGVRNYLTSEGAQHLGRELKRLIETERPRLTADPSDVDARRELQQLDRRIRHLQQSLHSADIVEATANATTVRFGSTVTVLEPGNIRARYRLVGAAETGIEPHWISWRSPLAQALLEARKGDVISFATPAGRRELTVVDIGG